MRQGPDSTQRREGSTLKEELWVGRGTQDTNLTMALDLAHMALVDLLIDKEELLERKVEGLTEKVQALRVQASTVIILHTASKEQLCQKPPEITETGTVEVCQAQDNTEPNQYSTAKTAPQCKEDTATSER